MRSVTASRTAAFILLLVICLIIPAAGDANLLAWYKFDEASGTVAVNSSGTGNATLVNGPTWLPGMSGNSVNLDGSNDYVTLPAGIISSLNDFTISAWVNLDTISSWSRIFDFGTGTQVNMFLSPRNGSTSVIRFAITTAGSGGEQRINGTQALPTSVWKHVAVTLSGSVGILYVDGIEVGRNDNLTLKPSSLGNTTQNYLGRSQYSDPYLDGRIDDFRIYSRALSPGELAEMVSEARGCIGKVKTRALGTDVSLGGKAVTGAFSGFFYIQDPEPGHPACGIKVIHASAQTLGYSVGVSGYLDKDDNDELVIRATTVTSQAADLSPKARGCTNKYIGGGTVGDARGPDGGAGINMIGVLQTTWGKVSSLVKNVSMIIDDGSGCPIKVLGPTGSLSNGDFARVTGVACLEKDSSGVHHRVLRLRKPSDISGGIDVAGNLVVELDARNTGSDPNVWVNLAPGLGNFTKLGDPSLQTVAGQLAMRFDGIDDVFVGPVAPSTLTARSTRSIEVWAYNPSASSEETMVSWGRRGSTGLVCSFNYGTNSTYGAATHWALDLGWDGVPAIGKWHHLVYTYDGTTVRVYDNTLLKNSRTAALNTSSGYRINLAAQNDSSGNPNSILGSLSIAAVRIHTGVLTATQIRNNFFADAARFGAKPEESFDEKIASAVSFDAGAFTLKLIPDRQTVVALSPRGSTFDFSPGDRLRQRHSSGFYNLGDVNIRVRNGQGTWTKYSSSAVPDSVVPVPIANGYAADLTPAFGAASPVSVERQWIDEDGKLVLRYIVRNQSTEPVEIGSFGAAMVFNNIFSDRNLTDTHTKCSFTDPYIGGDAGYVQVTRVSGDGPALIVYPEAGTSFEAFRHLREDPTALSVTFEGFYEWMMHTRAYTENEWAGKEQFNAATSRTLAAGESATYGFVFVLTPQIKSIEDTLLANSRPVAIGVPGYVLTRDHPGRLFVKHNRPIQSVVVEPASAITVTPDAVPTPNGWHGFTLTCHTDGRSRMVITYDDGSRQFIHYNTVPSQAEQVTRLANFHETHQWYTDPTDPFRRTYSYMFYDRQADKLLTQEPRVFNCGLSDECGAGPNLLMAMKNLMQPDPVQVAHLEQYVDNALWGNLQYTSNYGVKASLFYYDPVQFPNYYEFTSGWLWDKARCDTTWRSYNYPHQAAVYWALYRIARNYTGLATAHTWQWYLTQAYKTGIGMRDLGGYNHVGLMDGSVFLEILRDMKREGWTTELTAYENFFRGRADRWSTEAYPFGSEMPWDSTGQEEVYQWCKYYGYQSKAEESLSAVTAYMPAVPNWAYNGAARRYWDSAIYGKIPVIYRQAGHYGSSLNAIPMIDSYRDNPTDFYKLRVGYGGTMNILPCIDERGHGSMTYSMDPAYMDFDPYTGDFGSAFFGYAYNAGAYAYNHDEFGWLGFGCVVSQNGGVVSIVPKDAFHSRVYIGSLGLYLTLDSGTFDRVDYNTSTGKVDVVLSSATVHCTKALLNVARPGAPGQTPYSPTTTLPTERGSYSITLGSQPVLITLQP